MAKKGFAADMAADEALKVPVAMNFISTAQPEQRAEGAKPARDAKPGRKNVHKSLLISQDMAEDAEALAYLLRDRSFNALVVRLLQDEIGAHREEIDGYRKGL